jgi:hypothetical protein
MTGSALRRLTFDEPVSRLAIWSNRLAKISLLLALAALAAAHSHGALARFFAALTLRPNTAPDPSLGLFVFLLALAVAALALVLAGAAAVSIWVRGRRGVPLLFATALLVALLAPYPAYLAFTAESPAWLADIATDPDDPPAFSTAPEVLAARNGWTPEPLDPARRREQVAAYPDVATIPLDMEPEEAFKAARDAAAQLRWTIVEEIHPGGPKRPEGHIEALVRSTALGIPRAVSIRIRPAGDQVKVDVRIVTRYLPNDLGAGAALIGQLRDILEENDGAS